MTSKNPNRKNFTADTSGSPGNAGKSNPKNSKSVGKNSGGNKYKDQNKSAPRSPSLTPDRSNSKPVDLPKPNNVGKVATSLLMLLIPWIRLRQLVTANKRFLLLVLLFQNSNLMMLLSLVTL